MPSGLCSERHPFTRDRVVFSFVCFPYLSLPRIASYPANNPSSCNTGHTNQLSVLIMSLPAPSLLSFLLSRSLFSLLDNTFRHNAATTRQLVCSLFISFSPSLSTYYSFSISSTSKVAFSSTKMYLADR